MNMYTDPATLTAAVHDIARAVPFATETFDAYVIADSQLSRGKALPIGGAETLEAAIQHGTERTVHKGTFEVRHVNHITGVVMRRFYQVKRKSKGERRYSDYQTRTIHDLYAEHLFDLRGDA